MYTGDSAFMLLGCRNLQSLWLDFPLRCSFFLRREPGISWIGFSQTALQFRIKTPLICATILPQTRIWLLMPDRQAPKATPPWWAINILNTHPLLMMEASLLNVEAHHCLIKSLLSVSLLILDSCRLSNVLTKVHINPSDLKNGPAAPFSSSHCHHLTSFTRWTHP